MQQRDSSLDIIRILACFMVVLMHSPLPSANANGPFLSALSYLTAPSVGLFFMVSGALLLPVQTDYATFIKKRFSKIAVPTLVWSLIYIAIKTKDGGIDMLQSLLSLPFSAQGEGVLWFMYTLAGLYLLAPILSAWVEKASQRELRIVLLLWAVTLCYPLLDFFATVNTSTTGILYYFTGYAGHFLLGYYLKKYPQSVSAVGSWAVALGGIALLLTLKYLDIQFDFYRLFWYESIFIAALAVAIWKTIRAIVKNACSPIGAKVSNLTFGVYLIHILIMRHWLWHQTWIVSIHNYPLQCLSIAIITMLLSTLACLLIARLPMSQWLIGFSTAKKK